ncbi:hypothetical protein [Planobispora longispora]|nr:hypothetical protein [Planobispora longispora]
MDRAPDKPAKGSGGLEISVQLNCAEEWRGTWLWEVCLERAR